MTKKSRRVRESVSFSDGSRSSLGMWRDGMVLAAIVALVGLYPLLVGHFAVTSRGSRLVLDGGPARALGLAIISLAACLHFHFFWQRHEVLSDYSQAAMIIGAFVFLASLAYIAWTTLL